MKTIISSLTIAAAACSLGLLADSASASRSVPRAASCGWKIARTSGVRASRVYLTSVAARRSGPLWATGYTQDGEGASHPLIERNSGSGWRRFSSRVPGVGALDSIASISPTDAWAVGVRGGRTLTEHYDGVRWTVVASPTAPQAPNVLLSVAGSSPNNVWAVGDRAGGPTGTGEALIERFNGTRWTIVPGAGVGMKGSELQGVTVGSQSDVWAVGSTKTSLGLVSALVEHYNGTRWSVVASPSRGGAGSWFTSVAQTSASNIWAAGNYTVGKGAETFGRTLIERYNGVRWSVVATPSMGSGTSQLNAISAAPRGAWAVGTRSTRRGLSRTLIERYNGLRWVTEHSRNVAGAAGDELVGVVALSRSRAVAVGGYLIGGRSPALVEVDQRC